MKRLLQITLICLFPALSAQDFTESAELFGVSGFAAGEYGSGISAYDWNKDGFDDLVLLTKDSLPQFYLNNTNGFTRVFFEGIEINNDIKSVNWVDFNNDGFPDLSFNSHLGGPTLYQNNGNFTFLDVTEASGIIQRHSDWGFGHNWGDYNRDGFLDVFYANYNWSNFEDGYNHLYKSSGDGTFVETTEEVGIGLNKEPTFVGLWCDYNNDNITDLYVLNDRNSYRNYIYENTGNDTFSDQSENLFFDIIMDSMTASGGDFNNDGLFDIYITNTPGFGNKLFRNSVVGFQESAFNYGLQMFEWSWGAVWIDAQNSGWQDLFVVTQPNIPFNTPGKHFFFNNTGISFDLNMNAGFEGSEDWTFSTARGDFNNDGKADLITHSYDPLGTELWINSTSNAGNYLKVRLEGVVSNKDAIGCRLELYTSQGNQYRYTYCGEQYISQNSQWQFFGLGDLQTVDSLVIIWPSGIHDVFHDVQANQALVIQEGSSIINLIQIQLGELIFCEGDSVVLFGGNFESYLWSNGDTSKFTTVLISDTLTLEVFNGFQYLHSDTIIVQSLASPLNSVVINNPDCHDESTGSAEVVTSVDNDFLSIQWSNGSDSFEISDLLAGTYSYELSHNGMCPVTGEITLENPPTFEIDSIYLSLGDDTDLCPGDISAFSAFTGGVEPIQVNWVVFNSSGTDIILESSNDTLHCVNYFEPRLIKCVIRDFNQCKDSIYVLTDEFLSLNSLNNNNIIIFPNPFNQDVFISNAKNLSIVQVTDMLGKSMPFKSNVVDDNYIQVAFENIPNGIYFISYSINNEVFYHKLICTN
ncbi:MAG: FG-GAP-like repeat-containing protein [Bacteroidia bacterium]